MSLQNINSSDINSGRRTLLIGQYTEATDRHGSLTRKCPANLCFPFKGTQMGTEGADFIRADP